MQNERDPRYQIIVIGCGYVGLVTGACFAEIGVEVICVDKNSERIAGLKNGVSPIYEPGLETLLRNNLANGRLRFAESPAQAQDYCADATVLYFIAVGTPTADNGAADIHDILEVADAIADVMGDDALVICKSTAPVGTGEKLKTRIAERLAAQGKTRAFDVVSNPEFLKEGSAVQDFMHPDRVIIGVDSARAKGVMQSLYEPFTRNHHSILYMGLREAEMTKYAANAMLATKISFINEIAALCEKLNVDIEDVRLGIGSDSRIGYDFIYPGCGYGGSCFPKDVKSLIETARKNNVDAGLLRAVEARNDAQKNLLVDKIKKRLGDDLTGRCFALWGLSFKPGTDDMREAPSLSVINGLLAAGADVRCYDPVAAKRAAASLPADAVANGRIVFSAEQYDALDGADALILVTEWKSFQRPDFTRIGRLLNQKLIFDGRNQYQPDDTRRLGFEYFGIGRGEA